MKIFFVPCIALLLQIGSVCSFQVLPYVVPCKVTPVSSKLMSTLSPVNGIDLELLYPNEEAIKEDEVEGPMDWLRHLRRLPPGISWSVPVAIGGILASMVYTGYTGNLIGFRFNANVGNEAYSVAFTTTAERLAEDIFQGTVPPDTKKRKTRKVRAKKGGAKYKMVAPPNTDLPDIDLTIFNFEMGDKVMDIGLESEKPGLDVTEAAASNRFYQATTAITTGNANKLAASFLYNPQKHKAYCKANVMEGDPDTSRLTKEINTALDLGSLHVQQVKDFEDTQDEESEILRKEAAEKLQQASIYLTEYTRHFLNNMVILKTKNALSIDGEYITIESGTDPKNSYAKVGFPTFTNFVNKLPIGFLGLVSTSSFNKVIKSTAITSKLVESVVESLGIVNNPVFQEQVVTRLGATIDNLLQIVKENRKENLETRLFTITPLTEVRNGDTIVTIKLTEFEMKASTWVDVFDACNVKTESKGAKLEYKTREVDLEASNKLLGQASEVILAKLSNAIKAYDNSEIPDEIDISVL